MNDAMGEEREIDSSVERQEEMVQQLRQAVWQADHMVTELRCAKEHWRSFDMLLGAAGATVFYLLLYVAIQVCG